MKKLKTNTQPAWRAFKTIKTQERDPVTHSHVDCESLSQAPALFFPTDRLRAFAIRTPKQIELLSFCFPPLIFMFAIFFKIHIAENVSSSLFASQLNYSSSRAL